MLPACVYPIGKELSLPWCRRELILDTSHGSSSGKILAVGLLI